MADGGTFSNDIDGGGVNSTNVFVNLDLQLNYLPLYSTGNLIHTLTTGEGFNTLILTGEIYDFGKIYPSNIQNNTSDLESGQLFSLLPSDSYKIYDSINQIVYLTNNDSFLISGILPNNNTKTVTITADTHREAYTAYVPVYNEIIPSANLLYVYNLSSQESIDIKNYYFQMRTGITGANVLAISCSSYSGVSTDTGNYINNIRTPIHRHLITGGKPIKYVCLFHGIPSFVTGSTIFDGSYSILAGLSNAKMTSNSVSWDLSTSLMFNSGYSRYDDIDYREYSRANALKSTESVISRPFLFEEYSGQTALFCHLATLESKTADLSGYIRRICNGGIVSGIYLLGSGQNNNFVIYWDTPQYGNHLTYFPNASTGDAFYESVGVSTFVSQAISNGINMTGENVCGFSSNGFHGRTYPDGTGTTSVGTVMAGWAITASKCSFSGYNWYLSSHYESNAGQLDIGYTAGSHDAFERQIRPTSLGGADYSNIPVGFVGSLTEPGIGGIETVKIFDSWFLGRPFIEAAYMGIDHVHYGIFGDPLVKFK